MITAKCVSCGKKVFVPETHEEEWHDPRATEYWSCNKKDDNKHPYCDAACALVAHLRRNEKEIPDWLIDCQK